MRAAPRPNVVGPVPKRSEDRIRHDSNVIDKVHAFGVVRKPDLGLGDDPHPIIVDFWNSVGESAQSRYYEPSDWQYFRVSLHFLNNMLKRNDKASAQMLTVINQMLQDLLVAEGSRRRVRMEIERNVTSQDAEVKNLSDYFKQLSEKNDLGDMFDYA
jgi:hypothetical protein